MRETRDLARYYFTLSLYAAGLLGLIALHIHHFLFESVS